MRVMAIDPGKTTGWAFYDTDGVNGAGECASVQEVYRTLNMLRPDTVVVEAFAPFPWAAVAQAFQPPYAAEVIGVVELWCFDNEAQMHKRPPSARKAVPAEWLKKLGFWSPCRKMPHAKDAARHLISFLIATNVISVPA